MTLAPSIPIANRSLPAICLLLVVIIFLATPVSALEGRIDLATGYDDNVEGSADKRGSTFMRYQLEGYQGLAETPSLYVEGYGRVSYHDFGRVDDRHDLLLGVSCYQRWLNGAWHSQIYVEGHSYRDDLVDEDDCDSVEIGVQLDHYWNERIKLGVLGYYRFGDYRSGYQEVITTVVTTPEQGGQGQHSGTQMPSEVVAVNETSREDKMIAGVVSGEYRFSADLSCDVRLFYLDNESTVDRESYHSFGLEHGWRFQINPRWSTIAWGSWYCEQYPESDDQQWQIAMRVQWLWRPRWNVYFEGQQLWHRSDYPVDEYNEKVATCGLSWSF
jgi:hypothetical protein